MPILSPAPFLPPAVQLEDDIVAKPNYLSTMKNFALQQPSEDWMILEFSQLGFIGAPACPAPCHGPDQGPSVQPTSASLCLSLQPWYHPGSCLQAPPGVSPAAPSACSRPPSASGCLGHRPCLSPCARTCLQLAVGLAVGASSVNPLHGN